MVARSLHEYPRALWVAGVRVGREELRGNLWSRVQERVLAGSGATWAENKWGEWGYPWDLALRDPGLHCGYLWISLLLNVYFMTEIMQSVSWLLTLALVLVVGSR